MEAPEVPIEQVQEHIHEHAHHAQGWSAWVALSTAIMAAFAAIAALLSGHFANEGILHQIAASDKWSYYQAKSVKSALLTSKMDILKSMGKTVGADDEKKLAEYETEKESIKKEGEHDTELSKLMMERHETLSKGVTLFQIAISIGAISVLTKRRRYWLASLIICGVGVYFLIAGLVVR